MLIDYKKVTETNISVVSINTDKIVYISKVTDVSNTSVRPITLYMEGGYTIQIDDDTYNEIKQIYETSRQSLFYVLFTCRKLVYETFKFSI